MTHLFDCTGKIALVTGGNSGIGLGFATGIARMGGDIAIWSIDPSKHEAARQQLLTAGAGRVLCHTVDVSDEAAVVNGYRRLLAEMGRVDCVIANAGMAPNVGSFLELDSHKWHALLNVNLHGAFYTLHHAAQHMVARARAGDPGGSLVMCGSLSMFQGFPGTANYAAAKAGMAAVVRAMAVELGEFRIRANTVAPGFTKTGITEGASPEAIAKMDAYFSAKTPLDRPGTPEDFEGIGAYLCSDASRFHSGDVLVIDGASLMLPAQAT